jgi:hypothetical protein
VVRAEPEPPRSWVCREIVDRFLGLPSAAQDDSDAPAALAGRWWVRGCELGLKTEAGRQSELTLHLDGPGWYWVDFEQSHLELHQQVPFQLEADIAGTIRFAYVRGVASLWFQPTRAARVQVNASTDLQLHGATVWGSLLRRVPLLPLRSAAAERLSDSAAAAITAHLQRGLTVTYDLAKGQSDMTLGMLGPGETPRRVFEDRSAWIANDRLLLPHGATQVFGPLQPTPVQLDVIVERGPGIVYRALCTRDMASQFDELARGTPERISSGLIAGHGELIGAGQRSALLHVERCPYYLVVTSAGRAASLVALRIRLAAS